MGRFSKVGFLLLCSIACSCKAFIYESAVLRRWDKVKQRYHQFIGLSDFHEKSHQANREQRADLRQILKNCYEDSIKIGAEDISSPSQENQPVCGRFTLHSRGGVLGGLTKTCKKMGLKAHNFEFRFCRVAALGPVINNLHADMHLFPSVTSIKVESLIREIESVFQELLSYQDEMLLQDLYRQYIVSVKQEMKALKMYQYAHETVADYLQKITNRHTLLPMLKKLLTFDSALLDLRMLHSVLHSQEAANFLAIAGGSHIECVVKLLQKLGYKQVHTSRPTFIKQYNINKCLGVHIIDGKYCKMPQPIDIRSIQAFL